MRHIYDSGACYVDYDSGESNTVIPHNMRRSRTVGCELKDLQPPIRPISCMEATDALVWSRQSVCNRLLSKLISLYSCKIEIWREEKDKRVDRSWYWNVNTKEVTWTRPPSIHTEENYMHSPEISGITALKRIMKKSNRRSAFVLTTLKKAREVLKSFRDLILKLPSNGPKGESFREMNQKCADLLTILMHTRCFFVPSDTWLERLHHTQRMEHLNSKKSKKGSTKKEIRKIQNLMEEDYMQGGLTREPGEDASIIELLLGWYDQSTPRPELCGTVVVPDVESAYINIGKALLTEESSTQKEIEEKQNNKRKRKEISKKKTTTEELLMSLSRGNNNDIDMFTEDEQNHSSSTSSSSSSVLPVASKEKKEKKRYRSRCYIGPGGARELLLSRLEHPQQRFSPWSSSIRSHFPYVAPVQSEAWPPVLPPVRLFGSPVLDASIFENEGQDSTIANGKSF